WALWQMGQFAWLVVQLLFVGVVHQIATRQFRWRAFISAFLWMALGTTVIAIAFYARDWQLDENRHLLLWGGVLITMVWAGFAAGVIGQRLSFWEIYLSVILVAVLWWVQLGRGWDLVLGFGPDHTQAYLDFLSQTPPGMRYLGSMWDRQIGLMIIASFLVAIFGGSWAFIIYGESRRVRFLIPFLVREFFGLFKKNSDGSTHKGRFFSFESFIGMRHIAGSGANVVSVTAMVAVLGVMLGVGSLVAVTAVMSGYQKDIQDRILSTNAHLVVQKYGIDFSEHEEITRQAMKIEGVVAATPFSFSEAMLSSDDMAYGVLLKGVVPETTGDVTDSQRNLCQKLEPGEPCLHHPAQNTQGKMVEALATIDDTPSIVVGYELFKKIGKPLGSPVVLTTPIGIAGATGNAPKRMLFKLGGVFRAGLHEFDSRLCYLELGASQKLLGMDDNVSGVEFKVADAERVESMSPRVLAAVGRYPYRIMDWRELNAGIFTALQLQKIVMFLVLTFIVIVAAFNIASTLF
ncbi:ABC transporter permease, partial [Myxococcota bacterium]|nr:ABC transporter permease [Myxococcota bacterium]